MAPPEVPQVVGLLAPRLARREAIHQAAPVEFLEVNRVVIAPVASQGVGGC